MKPSDTYEHRMPIVYGVLCIVLTLVVLQLWLLTATMESYLGGDDAAVVPAALASLGCFLLNAVLIRYLYLLERSRP
jgi:hypothetical protein